MTLYLSDAPLLLVTSSKNCFTSRNVSRSSNYPCCVHWRCSGPYCLIDPPVSYIRLGWLTTSRPTLWVINRQSSVYVHVGAKRRQYIEVCIVAGCQAAMTGSCHLMPTVAAWLYYYFLVAVYCLSRASWYLQWYLYFESINFIYIYSNLFILFLYFYTSATYNWSRTPPRESSQRTVV